MKSVLCTVLIAFCLHFAHAQRDAVTDALGGMRGEVIGKASETIAKNGEGSTVELKDGTILHAFSRHMRPKSIKNRPNADLWPAVVAETKSKDGGLTWSDPVVMFRSSTGDNAMQPGFVRMKNGELGISYSQIDSSSHATKVFRYSRDEGESWSTEILISPSNGYWTSAHDRMLLVSSGRILIPLHHGLKKAGNPHRMVTRVAYSDDNGRTWRLDKDDVTTTAMLPDYAMNFGQTVSSGFWEASIAELANGKLLILGRTYGGALYSAISSNDGLSWTKPKPTSLNTGAAPGRLIRVPGSNDLLVLWNSCCVDTKSRLLGDRLTLSSEISTDNGKTWKWKRDIEAVVPGDGNSVEYPAITWIDGRAFVTYRAKTERDHWLQMEEYLSVLPLSWFYVEWHYDRAGLSQ